jgi:hypothetical protein
MWKYLKIIILLFWIVYWYDIIVSPKLVFFYELKLILEHKFEMFYEGDIQSLMGFDILKSLHLAFTKILIIMIIMKL